MPCGVDPSQKRLSQIAGFPHWRLSALFSSSSFQVLKVMTQLKLKLKLNSWFVLFIFWLLFSSTEATDPKYCDKKGNYPVKVDQVKIIPDPVLKGKPATFKISAVTGRAISGGKVVIYVSYFGVPVHQEDHDLCGEISCPISAGNFVLSHTQTLPGFAPPGPYTLKMTMKDKKDELLSCFSFNFKIVFGSLIYEN